MTDANLMRWLSPQLGGAEVGLIDFTAVGAGPEVGGWEAEALRALGYVE